MVKTLKGKNTMSEQSQTAKLIAVMAECLPEMSVSQKQRWIKDLKGMKDLLAKLAELRWKDNGDGTIDFVLPPTDGTTGEQWIKRTEKKGNHISDFAKQVLLSKGFKPTTGVTYTVKVLKGSFFSDSCRTTKNILAEAKKYKLSNINAEAACLIREYFMDEELRAMGLLHIVVMHDPIKHSDGSRWLLVARLDGGGQCLDCFYFNLADVWDRIHGFAFSAA